MKRHFFILHSRGSASAWAESAAEALRQACIPEGFRDALAVVDASIVARRDESGPVFTAHIGTPPAPSSLTEGAAHA